MELLKLKFHFSFLKILEMTFLTCSLITLKNIPDKLLVAIHSKENCGSAFYRCKHTQHNQEVACFSTSCSFFCICCILKARSGYPVITLDCGKSRLKSNFGWNNFSVSLATTYTSSLSAGDISLCIYQRSMPAGHNSHS